MKKLFLFFVISILFLSNLYSFNFNNQGNNFIGIFRAGSNITLYQTCTDCSWVRLISVYSPNGTYHFINQSMTNRETFYNYTYTDTSTIGQYSYIVLGNKSGTLATETLFFETAYSGKKINTAQGIIYLFLLIVFLFFIFSLSYVINRLPDNEINEDDRILKISYLKYLKLPLYFFIWICLIAVIYLSSNLSFAYLEEQLFAKLFFNIFRIIFPLTLIVLFLILFKLFENIITDRNLKKMIERGFFNKK